MGAAPPLISTDDCITEWTRLALDWTPPSPASQAVEDHERGAQGMPPVATSRATSSPVRSNKPRPSLAD